MKTLKYLFISLLLLIGCAKNDILPLYEGVPTYASMYVLKYFIEVLNFVDVSLEGEEDFYGSFVYRPLIDENGKVEVIYKYKPKSKKNDKLLTNLIFKAKFKSLYEVTGKRGKYSLIVGFHQPLNYLIQIFPVKYLRNLNMDSQV
jgi:hypothetical protein